MEKQNKKEQLPEDIKGKIKDRESWFKVIGGTILLALIAYKLAVSELNFDFSKFDFSDLLSLTLAIFSIGLSVAFYFKATDTSNKFYDNTYKFTKEISEILGRIEAGFGERLRHLDEGYSGLVDKFDGNSVQDKTDDIEAAKLELEEEKKKIEKEVEEKDQILETLLKKAKVNDTEKAKILSELKEKEQEISSLSNEMRYLKRNISRAERSLGNDLIHSIPPSLREMITDYLKSNTIDINMLLDAPLGYLKRRMKFEKEKFPLSFYERFLKYDIIENDDRFTERGLEIMKYLANRI
mgnify:FL=1|tara:strand:+ start:801 stop:1688 length:888 start_codon:yes stop_codon:yes gene_type:complete